jgi:hypothetical protein
MSVSFNGLELRFGDCMVTTPWPVMDAFDDGHRIIALLNPDAYLTDPVYKAKRRSGMLPNRNLLAYSYEGRLLWEAEFPSDVDYYYRISSRQPLLVNSFSSFRCEIDSATGKITRKEFFK